MAREWYFVENGQQRGPVPTEELKGMVRAGRLRGQDLVWNEALTEWTPVFRLPEIAPAPARPAASPLTAPNSYAGHPQPYGAPAPAAAGGSLLAYQSPGGGTDAPVSPRSLEMLRQTKPWVRFISALSWIVGGGMALIAALGLLGGIATRARGGGGPGGLVMLVYLGLAGLVLAPALFLGRFASRIGDLLQTRRGSDLEAALEAQKSYWRFVGILALLLIGLGVVSFLVMVVGFVAYSATRH